MPGDCHFQEKWLAESTFKYWVAVGLNGRKTYARCTVCDSCFDIKAMGRTALTSHAKGSKHQERLQIRRAHGTEITMYFNTPPVSSASPSTSCSGLSTHMHESTAINNYPSINSNTDIGFVFQNHVPWFTRCLVILNGRKKPMYVTTYGIAPYLKSLVKKHIREECPSLWRNIE